MLRQEPDNGRASWLKSRVLLSAGKPFAAIEAVKDAIRLQPDMPEYRLTRARIGGAIGKYDRGHSRNKGCGPSGVAHAGGQGARHGAVGRSARGQTAARLRAGESSITCWPSRSPTRLAFTRKVRVRREAKQVLLDAHLAVATDIARGQWKNQQKVVPQWIERADTVGKGFARRTKTPAKKCSCGSCDRRSPHVPRSRAASIRRPGPPKPMWLAKS